MPFVEISSFGVACADDVDGRGVCFGSGSKGSD